ncbi:MAG: toast rack family protein, partial [Chloroflexia bacterium]
MNDQTRNEGGETARVPEAGGQEPGQGSPIAPSGGQPPQPMPSAPPYGQPGQPARVEQSSQSAPSMAPYTQPPAAAGPAPGGTGYAPYTPAGAPAGPGAAAPAAPARRRTNPIVWVLLGLLVLLLACMAVGAGAVWFGVDRLLGQIPEVKTGTTKTDTKSVPLGSAQSVNVNVKMNQGKLTLAGGASGSNLLDANFTYNVAEWKPLVDYTESGGQGNLTVSVPESDKINRTSGNVQNDWDLRLNNDVQKSLTANMGAGQASLKLGGLNLTKVDLNTGAAQSTIDLSGDWKQNATIGIKSGVGETTVRLPKDVGVTVNAKGGLGKVEANGLKANGNTYTNDAYGNSPVTLTIDVSVGIGNIILEPG